MVEINEEGLESEGIDEEFKCISEESVDKGLRDAESIDIKSIVGFESDIEDRRIFEE